MLSGQSTGVAPCSARRSGATVLAVTDIFRPVGVNWDLNNLDYYLLVFSNFFLKKGDLSNFFILNFQ